MAQKTIAATLTCGELERNGKQTYSNNKTDLYWFIDDRIELYVIGAAGYPGSDSCRFVTAEPIFNL